MLDITRLSGKYAVRALTDADVDAVLALCAGNEPFYEYCQAEPTREQVLSDMRILPPGVDPSRKHYVGFYREGALTAVMDLIDGYPESDIAYIGFFMMDACRQGRGIGSAIVREALEYLKGVGMRSVRLAIDKANPQSNHFWSKNGFSVIREVPRGEWTILEAERAL